MPTTPDRAGRRTAAASDHATAAPVDTGVSTGDAATLLDRGAPLLALGAARSVSPLLDALIPDHAPTTDAVLGAYGAAAPTRTGLGVVR